MSIADDVRAYTFTHYIKPARERGERTVTITAGEIHRDMKFANRMPLVCSALGAVRFLNDYDLKLVRREGPGQSSTTAFVFAV